MFVQSNVSKLFHMSFSINFGMFRTLWLGGRGSVDKATSSIHTANHTAAIQETQVHGERWSPVMHVELLGYFVAVAAQVGF